MHAPLGGANKNPHHYHLELKSPTHIDDMNGMAQCKDRGWSPCPHFLKAAAEPGDFNFVIDRDNENGVTQTVWDALRFLLEDFEKGGDFVNDDEAFEACLFLAKMKNGRICFEQQKFSGLERYPRLAAFVELAAHNGFYFESGEDLVIVEHDMAIAFQSTNWTVRFVQSSFVALFDSGAMDSREESRSEFQRADDFHQLSAEAMKFFVDLLRSEDLLEKCGDLREYVMQLTKAKDQKIQWKDVFAKLQAMDRDNGTKDRYACRFADIFESRLASRHM